MGASRSLTRQQSAGMLSAMGPRTRRSPIPGTKFPISLLAKAVVSKHPIQENVMTTAPANVPLSIVSSTFNNIFFGQMAIGKMSCPSS